MSLTYETEVSLGRAIFGQVDLGDARRTKRLVSTFDAMQKHPGGTLPAKLGWPADLRAFYRLCDRDEVTHEVLIAAAREHALRAIAEFDGPVLMLHDATELDYSTLTTLADQLGQIGVGAGHGYICQNVLAVAAETGEVLGLMDQVLHCRDEVPKKQTLQQHRERQTRESLLWLHGTKHLPADPKLIDVSDQGSDTFEFLEHNQKSGRRFVLRACKVRKVHAGHAAVGPRVNFKEHILAMPELGRFTMDVQSQLASRGQKARGSRQQAEFVVRGGAVLVCPPHAKRGHHGNDPLPLYFVQVQELAPPPGEKAIAWTLLTNECVQTFEDAWRVTGWYERRWIIEEFHKAQKTGCQIEELQFTTTSRLGPAIALLSIVAQTLLTLRAASRRPDAKTRLATTIIAASYVEVLSAKRYRKVRLDLTVHEFFMALGRLGGHQNRKCDGPPGWLVLWRGWMQLQALLDGYDLAQQKRCGTT